MWFNCKGFSCCRKWQKITKICINRWTETESHAFKWNYILYLSFLGDYVPASHYCKPTWRQGNRRLVKWYFQFCLIVWERVTGWTCGCVNTFVFIQWTLYMLARRWCHYNQRITVYIRVSDCMCMLVCVHEYLSACVRVSGCIYVCMHNFGLKKGKKQR